MYFLSHMYAKIILRYCIWLCFIILSEFIVKQDYNKTLVLLWHGSGISQKIFNASGKKPNKLLSWYYWSFLGNKWCGWYGTEWRHGLSSEITKLKSCSFLFSLGKGSSSISSDVSSSTDHTPTQAQKNVATSEGRHLVFIISCPLFTVLAIFGRQIKCVSLSSVPPSGSIWKY